MIFDIENRHEKQILGIIDLTYLLKSLQIESKKCFDYNFLSKIYIVKTVYHCDPQVRLYYHTTIQ